MVDINEAVRGAKRIISHYYIKALILQVFPDLKAEMSALLMLSSRASSTTTPTVSSWMIGMVKRRHQGPFLWRKKMMMMPWMGWLGAGEDGNNNNNRSDII